MSDSIFCCRSCRPVGLEKHRQRNIHVRRRLWFEFAKLVDLLSLPDLYFLFSKLFEDSYIPSSRYTADKLKQLVETCFSNSRFFSSFSILTNFCSCFSSLFRQRDGRTCLEGELCDSKMSHSKLRF